MDILGERTAGSAGQRPWVRDLSLYAALFCLAFCVRFLFLMEISRTLLFSLLMNDAGVYDQWARSIAQGDWMGQGVFYQAPLYPYFLGLVYSVFGPDLFAARVIQIILGSLSCVFLAAAGRRFFSPKAGWIAGLMLALHPPAVYFDFIIQKAGLGLFWLTLFLLILGQAQNRPGNRIWLAAGAVLGCLCLVRENALLLVVLMAAWILVWFSQHPKKVRFAWGLCFLLGAGLALAPVALRNAVAGGQFFLTTSQFGPNFYIGNNPDASGMYAPLVEGRGQTEFEQPDAARLAGEALQRKLTPHEVSRYWTGRVLDYIRSQPLDWLGLMLRKAYLYWHAVEIPDTECMYTYARFSRVLQWLGAVFHFGVLLPLAVFGVCAAWGQRKRLSPLFVIGGGLFVSTIMFYLFARYRHPIAPVLMLFAGAGLVELGGLRTSRGRRKIAAWTAAALAAALIVNHPMPFFNQMQAVSFYNIGTALYIQGQDRESLPFFQEALVLDPCHGSAHYNLALALEALGRWREAEVHYRQAFNLNPTAVKHRISLQRLVEKMQQTRELNPHVQDH